MRSLLNDGRFLFPLLYEHMSSPHRPKLTVTVEFFIWPLLIQSNLAHRCLDTIRVYDYPEAQTPDTQLIIISWMLLILRISYYYVILKFYHRVHCFVQLHWGADIMRTNVARCSWVRIALHHLKKRCTWDKSAEFVGWMSLLRWLPNRLHLSRANVRSSGHRYSRKR